MISPARRHRDRHAALRAGETPPPEPKRKAAKPQAPSLAARKRARLDGAASVAVDQPAAANDNLPQRQRAPASPAAIQRLAMAQAKKRLKALQSIELRAHLKRELLPQFEAWVAGVVDAAQEAKAADPAFRAPQDDVVMSVLIWRLDVGDIDHAVHLYAFARDHGWALPANFKRNLATFVVEEACDYANGELDAGRPAPLAALCVLEQLVEKDDMPDEVRARLHKALGREFHRRADRPADEGAPVMGGQRRARLEKALAQLQRAFELDKQSGVKGDIGRVQKAIGKEEPPAGAEQAPPVINPTPPQEPPPAP